MRRRAELYSSAQINSEPTDDKCSSDLVATDASHYPISVITTPFGPPETGSVRTSFTTYTSPAPPSPSRSDSESIFGDRQAAREELASSGTWIPTFSDPSTLPESTTLTPSEPAPSPSPSDRGLDGEYQHIDQYCSPIHSPPHPPVPGSQASYHDLGPLHIPYPEFFDGTNPLKIDSFITQCFAHFSRRPRTYASDDDKIAFMLHFLKGQAAELFNESGRVEEFSWHGNFSTFIGEFLDVFGRRSRHADADYELRRLRMKHGDRIGPFLEEFEALTPFMAWNDSAVSHALYSALPLRITMQLDDLITYPSSYAGLRSLVIRLDAKHWKAVLLAGSATPELLLGTPEQGNWADCARGFFGTPLSAPAGSETPAANDLLFSVTPEPPIVAEPNPTHSDTSSDMPSLVSLPIHHDTPTPLSPISSGPPRVYQVAVPMEIRRERKRSASVAGLLVQEGGCAGRLRKSKALRRRELDLCRYCGSPLHHIGGCPRLVRTVADHRGSSSAPLYKVISSSGNSSGQVSGPSDL